jgi:hypothetical protein
VSSKETASTAPLISLLGSRALHAFSHSSILFFSRPPTPVITPPPLSKTKTSYLWYKVSLLLYIRGVLPECLDYRGPMPW